MALTSSHDLSCYEKKADINREHEIDLVQHRDTGKFYVRKKLRVYNPAVFEYLNAHPIPGIPRIYETAEEDSRLILIEEYIPGMTLQELLDAEGPLPEARVIEYTIQLCTILHSLHCCTTPLVHRDIKPSNIMLTPDGIVKLLDLNAARCADGAAAKDTVLMGTPGFAAPEQYGFGSSDAQTDLYAVGVLMNLLLTGELSHECTVSGPLAPIIRKCLMMERTKRYSSALEIRKALEKLQKNTASRSFLPPGFRGGNLLTMLFSTVLYLLVLWVSLTLEVQNASPAILWFERGVTLVFLLGAIFFSGNYRGMQSLVPLCRNDKTAVRVLGILFVDILFFLLCATILAIYESIVT